MNVRRVGLVLGVVIGFLGSAVRADDGVTLQYKLAKGDKLIYRTKSEMKQTQNIMGMAIENEMNNEAVSSLTVEGIDEKGNYQLTVKGERLKVNLKFGQLGDYVFDSQSSERDRKSTRLNSSHIQKSRMPSSA